MAVSVPIRVVIPRRDYPAAVRRLYRELKLKPCACGHHIVDGKRVYMQCGGCVAIEHFETVVEAMV